MPTARGKPAESATATFRVYGSDSFGVAIREFRRQRGLSQSELASRAGIHRSYLSELEGGKTTEHLERLVALFEALGVGIRLVDEIGADSGTT